MAGSGACGSGGRGKSEATETDSSKIAMATTHTCSAGLSVVAGCSRQAFLPAERIGQGMSMRTMCTGLYLSINWLVLVYTRDYEAQTAEYASTR